MRNAFTIAGFEIAMRLKRISTWVYFAVFFALALFWVAAAGGIIKSAVVSFGSGKVWINSPYAIAQTVSFLGMFGLSIIAAIMGRAVQQDFEYRVEHFFFSAPIRKWEYLAGRFAGAIAVLLIILSSIALGGVAGLMLPGLDPDRIGPVRPLAYILPYFTVLLPNLIVLGGLFFCLAALTRRMLPVYIGSVLLLIGFLAAQGLLRDMTNKTMASLLDPFGVVATSQLTAYWSISERNLRLLPLEGYLLWNRLLWLAIGALIIGLATWRFRMTQSGDSGRRRADAPEEEHVALPVAHPRRIEPQAVSGWRLLPRLVWLNFRETVKNIYFGVIALSGILFLVVTSSTAGDIFGTSTWPVTWQMLDLLSGTFSVFMLVIISFYAGELAWRERENRLDQIHDALPIPTWLPFVGKLLALMLVPVVLQALLMLCGLGIQTAKGYHHYEIGLYLKGLFGIELIDYWLVCVLAMTVHSLVNQKYLGHFIMIVYFIVITFAGVLGFEHNLYKYGVSPPIVYSDMNGFGHFLLRARAFQAYWASAAVLLAIAAYLFWVRGTTADWRGRVAVARRRFTRPAAMLAGAAALSMAGFGAFIYYNTNILNRYMTSNDVSARLAEYEKKYKALADVPEPKITAVKVAVDLYPGQQQVRMRGTYTLQNKTVEPISTVHLLIAEGELVTVDKLEFGVPAKLAANDVPIGMRTYELASPLPPGGTTELAFDLTKGAHGFTNTGAFTDVEYNGSFVNAQSMLPVIGYQPRGEITSDRDRKKFGLPPSERARDRDDPVGLAINGLSRDADFITFETTVSTEADQLAIAPGYLQREWMEGGRRYFEYRMDSPIANFYAYQSGRYAVKKDRWNDVAIEIYYQPGHEYNLDRMIAATKSGLDYFTANFGPYQHRQFRIIEFPRYQAFAQSFPNTIPYSEGIGFIARVREDNKDDIDYPYYVTAHELAHQWWGHQVVAGDVQGGTMLIETLAQYSALMVMKQKYGDEKMQRFLQYEMDRYLLGRSTEEKKELPLSRVENQPYIHYRKGSVVMYALQDYIGEKNLNRAIQAFLEEHRFKGPPYPNTTQLLTHIRAVTPSQYQYVIDDMFDSIVLYDNRAKSATARALPDGRYEVTLKVIANKRRADELGKETEVPLADWIDIGVLDADNKPLFLEKRKLDREETEFTVIVDRKPVRAGIDPYNKLIDRRPKDNTVAVDLG
ncbi:MAG TPA: M1 family aminopeptidase [Casimicrobiaceae bacterium]|nr:M1 family aminopeptidase [Casimicrobiaceae bacterium]